MYVYLHTHVHSMSVYMSFLSNVTDLHVLIHIGDVFGVITQIPLSYLRGYVCEMLRKQLYHFCAVFVVVFLVTS